MMTTEEVVRHNALLTQLFKAQEERDQLRQALEIIAVGDAQDPRRQAAEELVALGYWRDIPEALK